MNIRSRLASVLIITSQSGIAVTPNLDARLCRRIACEIARQASCVVAYCDDHGNLVSDAPGVQCIGPEPPREASCLEDD